MANNAIIIFCIGLITFSTIGYPGRASNNRTIKNCMEQRSIDTINAYHLGKNIFVIVHSTQDTNQFSFQ